MSKANYSNVATFYVGKSVFITGGTGFVGKTLIEKLLYSCSGIDKIYVLVRDKYGKQASERLARITSTPVFDRIKKSGNEALKKIVVISGDITRENLGLQDDVLKTLENEAFVHVSTAFTNSDRKEINEVVYPMPINLEEARHVADRYSHDDAIVSAFMGRKPNTYTFSKALAEQQVMKQCEDLPAAIVRPSIVMSSIKEPCPGWIDTWNGSTGLFVGMPAGVLRVVLGRGNNITDLVPVDIVTNLIVVAATECQKSKEIKVYNCCTGTSNPITCDEASTISRKVALKYSLSRTDCQTDYLMISNQRRRWTPAIPKQLLVHCRFFRDNGFGYLKIGKDWGTGRDWDSGNFTHTARHNAVVVSVRPWYHFGQANPFRPKFGSPTLIAVKINFNSVLYVIEIYIQTLG
ncbi:unnamed protein product [Spodoptera exigua]|nr:unnamed protein product [Spodoptera exigua]